MNSGKIASFFLIFTRKNLKVIINMKNLKSLKKFREEGLELTSSQQKAIYGKVAETSRLEPTTAGPKGDCTRFAKQDNPRLQDAENSIEHGTILADVTAANCHF